MAYDYNCGTGAPCSCPNSAGCFSTALQYDSSAPGGRYFYYGCDQLGNLNNFDKDKGPFPCSGPGSAKQVCGDCEMAKICI